MSFNSTTFLIFLFFLSPSANTTLHAQLSQVFEADSTQEWWVSQKGGNIYYGYVRALGQDSIVVIQGESGYKNLARADVVRITPKGAAFVPLSRPKHQEYGRYLQPFLVNALPHDNEVYVKLRYAFTPEIEVNFLNRHSAAVFMSTEFDFPRKPNFYGLKYRYALPLNERLHWAGALMYRNSPSDYQYSSFLHRHQLFLSSIMTFDAGFAHFTLAPIYLFFSSPGTPFTRHEKGNGMAVAGMLQIPLVKFLSFNADWLTTPSYMREGTFSSTTDIHGHNLMLGLKFHSRRLHFQLSYLERSAIEQARQWFSYQKWRVTFSLRFGPKKNK